MKKLKNLLLVLLVSLLSLTSFTSFSQTTHTFEYDYLTPLLITNYDVLVGDSIVVINKSSYVGGNIQYKLNGVTIVTSDGVNMDDTICSFLVDGSLSELSIYTNGGGVFNIKFNKVGTVSTNNLNDLKFSVYPNPTSDVLNIKGDNIESVKVFDMNGQLVLSDVFSTTSISLNVSTLTNGYYTILINDVKQRKFIKL